MLRQQAGSRSVELNSTQLVLVYRYHAFAMHRDEATKDRDVVVMAVSPAGRCCTAHGGHDDVRMPSYEYGIYRVSVVDGSHHITRSDPQEIQPAVLPESSRAEFLHDSCLPACLLHAFYFYSLQLASASLVG